jgi:hypothetical protein
LRNIVNIPQVYPPPRPVTNLSISLLPGCGGKFVHTTKYSDFSKHKRTATPFFGFEELVINLDF